MISNRNLSILEYMENHPITSYKEIAGALQLKERSVRYNIDQLNVLLQDKGLACIEKGAKGRLELPKGISKNLLTGNEEFIYSREERISLLLLTLLIKNEAFKINQMCQRFDVSRSTIKNDVNELEKMLEEEGLTLEYTNHFVLVGDKKRRVRLLNTVFRKYIVLLINPPAEFNTFEYACIQLMHSAFGGISLPRIILCVDDLLEKAKYTLTDDSYAWYISSVMVLVWFTLHDKEYPLEPDTNQKILLPEAVTMAFIKELEEIIGCPISDKNTQILFHFLEYTNKYAHQCIDVDPLEAESVIFELIEAVSREMGVSFEQDRLLVDGLMNHVIPMIQRIKNHISIGKNAISLLSGDLTVFNSVRQICQRIDILDKIENEDEIVYLSIYFMASMKRLQNTATKRVLLICGHGYGTTTMLKETLLSEYKIQIMNTIPLYKINGFPDWDVVDCVVSTVQLKIALPRPTVVVNPIMKPEDYQKVEALGLPKKRYLPSIKSIERQMNFLKEEDRERVLALLEKEFGYQSVKQGGESYSLNGFLKYNCVQIIDQKINWEEATRLVCEPLLKQGFIEPGYRDNVVETLRTIGFYAVTDGCFALLHGKSREGVNQTCFSLLVNRQPVVFGDRKVQIIFCLAAKNVTDHIPAIITLMRMVKKTPFISELEGANSVDEVYQSLLHWENDVK